MRSPKRPPHSFQKTTDLLELTRCLTFRLICHSWFPVFFAPCVPYLFVLQRLNSQAQPVEPDKSGGIALIVDLVFFKGGKALLVKRLLGFAPDRDAVALVEFQPNRRR